MSETKQVTGVCQEISERGELKRRFIANASVGGGDQCWEWQGSRVPRWGYGRTKRRGVHIAAHRLSWMLNRGDIPAGMLVLHTCDNPPCVNPRHLYLGTDADNARDRGERGRGVRGEEHPNAKLTAVEVAQIRERLAAGESRVRLAPEFGVTAQALRHIEVGRWWK